MIAHDSGCHLIKATGTVVVVASEEILGNRKETGTMDKVPQQSIIVLMHLASLWGTVV